MSEIVKSRARSEPRERSKRTNNQALHGSAGERSDCGASGLVSDLRLLAVARSER